MDCRPGRACRRRRIGRHLPDRRRNPMADRDAPRRCRRRQGICRSPTFQFKAALVGGFVLLRISWVAVWTLRSGGPAGPRGPAGPAGLAGPVAPTGSTEPATPGSPLSPFSPSRRPDPVDRQVPQNIPRAQARPRSQQLSEFFFMHIPSTVASNKSGALRRQTSSGR
jgi:hypothetical protein